MESSGRTPEEHMDFAREVLRADPNARVFLPDGRMVFRRTPDLLANTSLDPRVYEPPPSRRPVCRAEQRFRDFVAEQRRLERERIEEIEEDMRLVAHYTEQAKRKNDRYEEFSSQEADLEARHASALSQWQQASPLEFQAFQRHVTNCQQATSSKSCIVDMQLWYPNLPAAVSTTLTALSGLRHGQLLLLRAWTDAREEAGFSTDREDLQEEIEWIRGFIKLKYSKRDPDDKHNLKVTVTSWEHYGKGRARGAIAGLDGYDTRRFELQPFDTQLRQLRAAHEARKILLAPGAPKRWQDGDYLFEDCVDRLIMEHCLELFDELQSEGRLYRQVRNHGTNADKQLLAQFVAQLRNFWASNTFSRVHEMRERVEAYKRRLAEISNEDNDDSDIEFELDEEEEAFQAFEDEFGEYIIGDWKPFATARA